MEIGERMALLNERDQLKEIIQRVRELHKPTKIFGVTNLCSACSDEAEGIWTTVYPCATIRALDGEE